MNEEKIEKCKNYTSRDYKEILKKNIPNILSVHRRLPYEFVEKKNKKDGK